MSKRREPRRVLREAERSHLTEIAAQQLFSNDKESQEALDYLVKKRKFNEKVIKDFGIGYVPYHIKNDDGDRHELAGKITYPIYNQYNELVAVSSRNWREGVKQKFWHESFDKPFYLYGFNIAKHYIQKYRKAILVEGEHDTMSMHRGGIKVTCGILGSAPQVFQIAMLMRYCDEIYTLFDSDLAGDKARKMTLKIWDQFNLLGYDLKIYNVELPHAKELNLDDDKDVDPDFYIKKFGAKNIMKIINEAKNKEIQKCQA